MANEQTKEGSVHATVTIKIVFDRSTVTTFASLRRVLHNAIKHLASTGRLSDGTAIVDTWGVNVEVAG